jgi:type II secretory pathway pseudopilin PulG
MVLVIFMTAAAVFLTAMMVPMLSNQQTKETYSRGQALRAAITSYYSQVSAYPSSLGDLMTQPGPVASCSATVAQGTNTELQGWCGPYLDQVFVENTNSYQTDGWGTLFQYSTSSSPPTLKSCGPDRTCGDSDDITF